jgi:hypothetical protein
MHSFISILVSQRQAWDQIAGFVGHLNKRKMAVVNASE